MEDRKDPVFFGEWIKRRRKMLDLTQEELAERAGCSVFGLRKIEAGERRPSKQLASLLAKALEIPDEDQQSFIRIARQDLNLERLAHLPLITDVPVSDLTNFSAANLPVDLQSGQPADHGSDSRSHPSASPSLPAPAPHIPLQFTPLIGRELEVTALERRFHDPECRLLTLTGIGGIGKTRLAQEFASRQQSAFPGGVFYFSLASVNSSEKIASAIADVLGYVFSGPSTPEEQLIHFIENSFRVPTLLVLDNLEHLLSPAAHKGSSPDLIELVSQILSRSPVVKILGTSRERLNLMGEWTYELHGLSVPSGEYLGRLEQYHATEFFLKCVQRSLPGFQSTQPDQAAIVRICQLLDGIPLAIELAAAWVGMLSCQEIAEEIQSNMDFLTTRMRDIPERHRSIRATFEHSWKLLSDDERQVLCQLSVFHGGFSRQAAGQVAGATLPVLSSLVDKSLVRRSESGRYDLHEVVRQYTLARLQSLPDGQEAFYRHCEVYLGFARDREKSLKSARQQDAIHQLTGEIDNILAAWNWAIQNRQFPLLEGSGRAFGWYFEIAGLYRDGINQLELLIQALKNEPVPEEFHRLLGLAFIHQALLYFRKGEFRPAIRLYEESIAVLRPVGDRELMADALIFLGTVTHNTGDYPKAQEVVEEGLIFARAANDRWFEALARFNLGYLDSIKGSEVQGYKQMRTALMIWRELGDPHAIAMGLNFLVPTQNRLGLYDEAKASMQESISICERSRNYWGMGTAYRFLGLATMSSGQYLEAQAHFQKSLEIFGETFIGWDIARTLSYLGDATLASGDESSGRKTYLEALQVARQSQAVPVAMDALLGLGMLQMRSGNLQDALVIFHYIVGEDFCEQITKHRAAQLCAELESCLPAAQTAEAVRLAQETNLAEIDRFLMQ